MAAKALFITMLLFSALGTTGECGPVDDGSACPGTPVASVILNIVNTNGQTIPAATIVFTVNGGASFVGSCETNCDEVLLAQGVVGRFDIQVAAIGYATATRTVNVPAQEDSCHPVTQNVTIVMQEDTTVGVLFGVWSTQTFAGQNLLRFGPNGEIVGAIFFDQRAGGDGNWYIEYNGHLIRGVAGQPITPATATDPVRTGDVFNFKTVTQGVLTGFETATLSADLNTLSGVLQGQAISYIRLPDAQIPNAIRDP